LKPPGFERLVIDPVRAEAPDRATMVEFRPIEEDPAELLTYRGRLVDAAGAPAAGVVLRLIAVVGRRDEVTFHSIQSGYTALQANVLRFEKFVTDEDGSFKFDRIPRRAKVELAWWGEGIAPARRYHLEGFSEAKRDAIQFEVQQSARIFVRVDHKAFPKAAHVSVAGGDFAPLQNFAVKPGDNVLEISDLAPGAYTVFLSEPPEAIPGSGLYKPQTALARQEVTLEAGQTLTVEFKTPDDE
jgi:hypothetical protein